MTGSPLPIEELLPHARPMLLLDEALACDASSGQAAVTIRPDSPFIGPEGVPAHIGIEFMAQTCGVWAGGEAVRRGGKAQPGYLLGTRSYRAVRPFFRLGERLTVTATPVFCDAGMGVFDCRIAGDDDEVLAEAQLSVYQPEEQREGEQP